MASEIDVVFISPVSKSERGSDTAGNIRQGSRCSGPRQDGDVLVTLHPMDSSADANLNVREAILHQGSTIS